MGKGIQRKYEYKQISFPDCIYPGTLRELNTKVIVLPTIIFWQIMGDSQGLEQNKYCTDFSENWSVILIIIISYVSFLSLVV